MNSNQTIISDYLFRIGYKKHKKSSYLRVINNMLFVISPQGKKKDLHLWYSIYPLALPDLCISMGWHPAAGRFPIQGKSISLGTYSAIDSQDQLLLELTSKLLPYFELCKSLKDLEILYKKGNYRAKYPLAFCMLSQKKYKEGQWLLHELTESFDKEHWGLEEQEIIWRFVKLKTYNEIELALENEKSQNIKKLYLAKHVGNC